MHTDLSYLLVPEQGCAESITAKIYYEPRLQRRMDNDAATKKKPSSGSKGADNFRVVVRVRPLLQKPSTVSNTIQDRDLYEFMSSML